MGRTLGPFRRRLGRIWAKLGRRPATDWAEVGPSTVEIDEMRGERDRTRPGTPQICPNPGQVGRSMHKVSTMASFTPPARSGATPRHWRSASAATRSVRDRPPLLDLGSPQTRLLVQIRARSPEMSAIACVTGPALLLAQWRSWGALGRGSASWEFFVGGRLRAARCRAPGRCRSVMAGVIGNYTDTFTLRVMRSFFWGALVVGDDRLGSDGELLHAGEHPDSPHRWGSKSKSALGTRLLCNHRNFSRNR